MKWSSPLPRLTGEICNLSTLWAWGFLLRSTYGAPPGLHLSVSLGPFYIGFYLTWPERSKP